MKEIKHKINDELGLHARPAGMLVKLCADFKSNVKITTESKTGDAKKIFSVMSLGAKCGELLNFTIEGEDEEAVAISLTSFLTENL